MKILLVEDDIAVQNCLVKVLKKNMYTVDAVSLGEEALCLYEVNSYDLVILDLNLPDIEGFELLTRFQHISPPNVLILSALNQTSDKIRGLNLGASDYLTKPFDLEELEARIASLLRRPPVTVPRINYSNGLCLDTCSHQIYYHGEKLVLTKKEYQLLSYLLLNTNKILSSETLLEHIWDSEFNLFSSTIRFHIHSLKKTLGLYQAENIIKTARGQGYYIEGEIK